MEVKMYKVKINEIEIYHGKNIESNDTYIQHFKERGKDVEHFLRDVIGRDKRFLIDKNNENSLTMAIEASTKVLKKANIEGSELDMIIFSSQLPEYVAPPSSVIIHNIIGGKNECICYDMNVNCAGMAIAIEHTSKYISVSPHIKKALIVGCDYVNLTINPENEMCYGHYGDAACAVILERTDEDCGLIDSKYHVNSVEKDNIVFPGCGFSKLFSVEDKTELMLRWKPFECPWLDTAVENMNTVLDRCGLTVDDVSMFCLSQFVYKNITVIREKMGIDESKSIYIGDKYAYTGTTSPFIALYEAINSGQVKRGDYIIFWTIGAGTENITMLFKY